MLKKLYIPVMLLIVLTASSCSLNRLAVRSTSGILFSSFEALMAEDDLELARTAIESDLKLLEGLIRSDPGNHTLLLLAAEGFTSYALAFVEDENPDRAVRLYRRGRDHAAQWLRQRFKIDPVSIERLDEFEKAVNRLPDKAVPGIFWLGNAWVSALMLSLDDVGAIADLPRVETLMKFVLEHDETYYYAGAHLFFCAYYGSRPEMLGGNPEKALHHIRRHREITGGTFLLGDFFEVKYITLPSMDEEAARAGLQHILDFDLDTAPDIRLVNRVAQVKAERLLRNLEDYL